MFIFHILSNLSNHFISLIQLHFSYSLKYIFHPIQMMYFIFCQLLTKFKIFFFCKSKS